MQRQQQRGLPILQVEFCDDAVESLDLEKIINLVIVIAPRTISDFVQQFNFASGNPFVVVYLEESQYDDGCIPSWGLPPNLRLPSGRLIGLGARPRYIYVNHVCYTPKFWQKTHRRHPLVNRITISKTEVDQFMQKYYYPLDADADFFAAFRFVIEIEKREPIFPLLFGEDFSQDCMLNVLLYCEFKDIVEFGTTCKQAELVAEQTVWKYFYCHLLKLRSLELVDSYRKECFKVVQNMLVVSDETTYFQRYMLPESAIPSYKLQQQY